MNNYKCTAVTVSWPECFEIISLKMRRNGNNHRQRDKSKQKNKTMELFNSIQDAENKSQILYYIRRLVRIHISFILTFLSKKQMEKTHIDVYALMHTKVCCIKFNSKCLEAAVSNICRSFQMRTLFLMMRTTKTRTSTASATTTT